MHRSLTLIPLASLLFAACAGGGGRAIELSIEGAGGKTAYFDRFENNQPYHVDSVTLDGSGKGTLRVKALPLDFYRIVVDQEQLIVALDSAEELSIEAKAGALATPTSISGSVHSEALHGFYGEIRAYETKRDSIRTLISADPSNSGAVNALNALNTGFYDRCKAFTQAPWSRSSETPRISNPFRAYLSYTRFTLGFSIRQGRHQLAQKSMSTYLPRSSLSAKVPPSGVCCLISGASPPNGRRLLRRFISSSCIFRATSCCSMRSTWSRNWAK